MAMVWGDVISWPGRLTPLELRANRPPNPGVELSGADVVGLRADTGADARITILRQSPSDVGYREIFVSVDGEEIAVLEHGESVTHQVPPGPHRIEAHNTLFWKTHNLVVKPGEHVRFIAINRAGWASFGFLLLLGACPLYLTFEREQGGARRES